MSTKKTIVKKLTYFDSVSLMRVSQALKQENGIINAVVGMGTDFNLDGIKRLNLYSAALNDVTPNDLIIAVETADENTAAIAIKKAEKLLIERQISKSTGSFIPISLNGAIASNPDSNIVLVSLPGRFAAREVKTALQNNKHVMLFSDNVTIEEEIELKDEAVKRGLLMMGPDCGTAIINGVPLAFANLVRRGNIGVVAASGTGLQEVTSLIHRFGCGISQAIGVGGRDLSARVEARMTILAVNALCRDDSTKVILLVSKPPAPETARKLYSILHSISKPIVIYFIGADKNEIISEGFKAAENLEDAASISCELSSGRKIAPLLSEEKITKIAAGIKISGKYIRGLYSGGTLCDETQRVLLGTLSEIYSNTPVPGAKKLNSIYQSEGHTIIDLGDDDFTRGKAHPMIDPTARIERLKQEFKDKDTGLILFDVVLGYGSHNDMAGAMTEGIETARKESGRNPIIAANILGTDEDYQNYDEQMKKLKAAGVIVFPSNISAAKFAAKALGGK